MTTSWVCATTSACPSTTSGSLSWLVGRYARSWDSGAMEARGDEAEEVRGADPSGGLVLGARFQFKCGPE